MILKDSLTGVLKPVHPDVKTRTVTIYACGVTPYSSAHVGHARSYVVFDLLTKVIRADGTPTRLVRNITDIDDKILAVAEKSGQTWKQVANHFADENRKLMLATGLVIPEEPEASGYLNDIFWLIEQLISKGLAYQAEDGDVLYRVAAYDGPLLMNHKAGSLRSDAGISRVDASGKEDFRDFALWKSVAQGDVGFNSPWGWGRPGWHIECSAMIRALFDGSVTIHGGGVDLKFPHHQAEIMQSEPVFGRPLADVWMHNGSVLSDGQKMSKSLGNFVTWSDALAKAEVLAPGRAGELLKFTLMQTHWQKPLDWSDSLLSGSYELLVKLTAGLPAPTRRIPSGLLAELSQNLNVPKALAYLQGLKKSRKLIELSDALFFLGVDAQKWGKQPEGARGEDVQVLMDRRRQARAQKNWALADALRQELIALGVDVTDSAA